MSEQPSTTPRSNRRRNTPPAPPVPVTLTLEADTVYTPWPHDGKPHNTLKFNMINGNATDANALFDDNSADESLFTGSLYPRKPALRAGMVAAGISTMPKTMHVTVTFTF